MRLSSLIDVRMPRWGTAPHLLASWVRERAFYSWTLRPGGRTLEQLARGAAK